MRQALSTIFDATRTTYYDPDIYEVCGVTVAYKNSSGNSSWDEWRHLLEVCLPTFKEAGWLEDLNRIEIADELIVGGEAGGQYRQKRKIVALSDDPRLAGPPRLVSSGREYVLLHEMVHHKHITDLFGSVDGPSSIDIKAEQLASTWDEARHDFYVHVSEYAGADFLEAVAETACGIMLGKQYSDDIIDQYYELGGPEPLDW